MALRKAKADSPVAIATEDGHAIIGGRPPTPEFQEDLNRQQSGLAPRGARKAPVVQVPETALLPSPAVAGNVLGKEIARLRGQAEGLERSLSARPGAFQGNANPYLADVQRANAAMAVQYRSQLAVVSDELAELEALDGQAVQVWAHEFMKTHPSSIRGGI